MNLKCSTVSILLLCNFFTITWCGKNGGQIVFPDSLSPKSPYSSAIGIGPTQSHSEKESKVSISIKIPHRILENRPNSRSFHCPTLLGNSTGLNTTTQRSFRCRRTV